MRPLPEVQAEIREVLKDIMHDVETANVAGLRASHLESNKFTKFGGRDFERQDVEQCNEAETRFVSTLQNLKLEMRDPKIDVFGDVAIMTCYNHVSYTDDGEVRNRVARNTLVFLNTDDGWKIVHEHVTPNARFEQ